MRSSDTQERISIKDERLDIDRIDQYRLSFFISSESCQLSIYDIQKKRLLLLEDIALKPELTIIENLEAIYDDHILISAGFWKEIQVFVRNKKFSLVPYPVFDRGLLKEYIRLNQPTDPNEDEYHFKILDDLGLAIAFGYQATLKKWFKEKYPKISLYFKHQGTGFLNALKPQLKEKAQSSLYLLLNNTEALIAGFNLSRTAIYNQFGYSDANQLIKLTMLTARQFSETPQDMPILLFGNKQQVETYLPTLKKYFKQLELGQRPSSVLLHPVFNELDEYEYFDILSNL